MKKTRIFPFLLFLGFFVISGNVFAQGIIIDHTCTNLTQIPPQYLDAAKQLTLHYAHTSHGSQVLDGSLNLESLERTVNALTRAVVNWNSEKKKG